MSPTTTLLLLIAPTLALTETFRSFDYCKINCGSSEHAACECKVRGSRHEVLSNPSLVEFRRKILWAHNYWRNHVASGNEHRPVKGYVGQSAKMLRMNYDMELEHIARCHGIQHFIYNGNQDRRFDPCNKVMNGDTFGQNLKAYTEKTASKLWHLDSEDHWYNEIYNVTVNTINKYHGPGYGVENFTQVVWGNCDLLGCVRAENKDNFPSWKFALICNYGSTFHDVSNEKHMPVYQRGLKCSQCPEGIKCFRNSEFPFLCGEGRPVPTDDATAGGRKTTVPWGLLVVTGTIVFK